MADKKLWIFAIQSYGAMASFDRGETDEDFDQEPVIVGHQYAIGLTEAKREMAEEIASDRLSIDKPKFYTDDSEAYEKLTSEQMDACTEYDNKIEDIEDELQFFELVVGGEHSTYFMS